MEEYIDIWLRTKVVQHMQRLLEEKQVKDCRHLRVVHNAYNAFEVKCIKDLARRIRAANVTTDITGYKAPTRYYWPNCPTGCESYSHSVDFTATLCGIASRVQLKKTDKDKDKAKLTLSKLISSAGVSIHIACDEINHKWFELLENIKPQVKVFLLTATPSLTAQFKVLSGIFARNHPYLEIRSLGNFFERIIIIDSEKFYKVKELKPQSDISEISFELLEDANETDRMASLFKSLWYQSSQVF